MNWLSSPRVRLGLLVNSIYFLSLLNPLPPPGRGRDYARVYDAGDYARTRPPEYAPLPPSTGPSKATTYQGKGTNQVEVYLTDDLRLVRKPGHTLLLSPHYTAGADGRPPDTILLRFVSFSHEQFYEDDSPLRIQADGDYKWQGPASTGQFRTSGGAGRHSSTIAGDGQVIETVGETMPYELYVEIASARSVVIELGPDRVELNAEQLEALRDLHRRLPRPPAAKKP